jgi:hypothetical protein
MRHHWDRSLKRVVVLLVLVGLTGCLSHSARQLGEVPPGSDLWDGHWRSEYYPGVFGDVAAALPENMVEQEDLAFTAPVVFQYAYLSYFRPGYLAIMTAEGKLSHGEGQHNVPPQRLTLSIRNSFQDAGGAQSITYQAHLNDNVLEGTYETTDPSDKGTFRLTRKTRFGGP